MNYVGCKSSITQLRYLLLKFIFQLNSNTINFRTAGYMKLLFALMWRTHFWSLSKHFR